MFWFNGQSLLQGCARARERINGTRGIAFCSRNHRLKPRLGIVEAVIDVLEIFAGRRRKDPFCFGKITVDQRQKYPYRSLSTTHIHLRVFRKNITQPSWVAGAIEKS